ncbi:MAG: hypothetical protein J6Q30_07150 [Oscillospiraceae bacterium]|nr:hypothetical protein [Oscillospiraceae bacterium]
MKKYLKPATLPWFVLVTGGIGIALRFWLLSAGVDTKGLLKTGHPAGILLWVLTAITAGVVIYGCLPLVEANKYGYNFPSTPISAIGEGFLALGILVVGILSLCRSSDTLSIIMAIAGFLSVPMLLLCAFYRWKGVKPLFLFHGFVCIFWVLRLISLYRDWSPDPQLQHYIFALLANIFVMLSYYQRTAFDAGSGNRRVHAITHLEAAFFCCLSIVGSRDWYLYVACVLWSITDLCRLTPMPKRAPHSPKKDEDHEPA